MVALRPPPRPISLADGGVGFPPPQPKHGCIPFADNGKVLVGRAWPLRVPHLWAQWFGENHSAAAACCPPWAWPLSSKPQILIIQHYHLSAGLQNPAAQRGITGTTQLDSCQVA